MRWTDKDSRAPHIDTSFRPFSRSLRPDGPHPRISDHHRRRTVLNSIDNKRRLARGDHGEDSPVRRAELERQLMEAEFECRYAMDEDRDSAADWRDSLQRQLDELKRIED